MFAHYTISPGPAAVNASCRRRAAHVRLHPAQDAPPDAPRALRLDVRQVCCEELPHAAAEDCGEGPSAAAEDDESARDDDGASAEAGDTTCRQQSPR